MFIEWKLWTNSNCMCGDGGCWYPNNFGDFRGGLIFKRLPVGLVTQRMRMGSSAADSRLHTAATTATSWPGSLNTNSQPSTQQNVGWNTKSILTMFCIIIIFEPYHFVLLLQAEDTGLQFSNSVWSSHGLFSVGRKHKMFWLATITTSQLLFLLLFVIWNTLIHHCISLRLRLFLAFESQLWCLIAHNNNPTLILIITH